MPDIVIHIDGSKFSDQVAPKLSGAIQNTMYSVLPYVKDKWTQGAQQKLHSSLPLYLQGFDIDSVQYPFEGDPFSGAVVLKGKLPSMLETGFNAFDMKVGFSNSQRKVTKKNGGWYLTIPLRHQTPGGKSEMYGKAMPKDVYGVAKKLSNGEKLSYPGVGDKSWTGYQRKNTKYDGLTRIVKSYQNTKQSQYYTFRRVSDKSDPMSWQHPGYIGIHVAQSIEPDVRKVFAGLLKKNIEAIGG